MTVLQSLHDHEWGGFRYPARVSSMIDLADLLRVPQVDTGLSFDVSPDGQNVAFAWNGTGNWEIYLLSLQPDGGSPRRISTGAGAKLSPRYAPDGKRLAYALDPDGSESYHIVLHDLGTNSSIDLTPAAAWAHQPNFAFSPDGGTLAILSDEGGQFALYLLSLQTGRRTLLLDLNHPIWDACWSPDGRWIAVEAEMQASDRGLFLVEVETGKNIQVRARGVGLNAQHPAWSPDSRFLACSAQVDEWFDIGLYEMETEEIHWLTQGPGDDTSPCWLPNGNGIGWVHADGAVNSIAVMQEGRQVKQVLVSAGIHHHPRSTPQGEILFLFESPRQPADLWKAGPDGTYEQLTNSLPDHLQMAGVVFPKETFYENEGVRVPALLYRGSSRYAVINIHGGPNWHAQFTWDPITAHMTSRGWTVLAPNYRGSTGYGRAWQLASRYDMGGVDTRDCTAGAVFLKQAGLADRIAVTGRSHGGYLTMTCLTQFPEVWCGGSAVVPFMNWFRSHEDSREDLQHWNIENMGDPGIYHERWYNASPYFFLDRVNVPIQLICGANDPRCPASDSLDTRDKLVELGKEVRLLLYQDEGHSFLKIENVIDAEMRRVDFLTEVLGLRRP